MNVTEVVQALTEAKYQRACAAASGIMTPEYAATQIEAAEALEAEADIALTPDSAANHWTRRRTGANRRAWPRAVYP